MSPFNNSSSAHSIKIRNAKQRIEILQIKDVPTSKFDLYLRWQRSSCFTLQTLGDTVFATETRADVTTWKNVSTGFATREYSTGQAAHCAA